MNRASLLLFGLLGLAPISASGQEPGPEDLKKIEQETRDAQREADALAKKQSAVQKEISGLQTQLVKIGSDIQGLETTATRLESELATAETKETRIKDKIYADRQSLMRLLAALQRIENNPPPALIVSPNDAANAVRAARLMSDLGQKLNKRADALRSQLADLETLQDQIAGQRQEASDNADRLKAQQNKVRSLMQEKSDLEASITKDHAEIQARALKLSEDANSLRELIRKLEERATAIGPRLKPGAESLSPPDAVDVIPRLKPEYTAPLPEMALPPDTRRFADARGRLRAPVKGFVSEAYNGGESRGMTVRASQGAQVIAPYSGRIEFAGPFKNYDKVIIMNVGDGYFLLLTGLGEIYAKSGMMVKSGEPVGLMPFNGSNSSELYIEIRKDGSPINPTPWLGTAFARQG